MDLGATRPEDTQPRLRGVVEGLERVQTELQEIADGLPEEDAEADGEVSLRAVIECVLADRLEPAVRDLRAAME
jgi:hypothetical protein